MKVFSCVTALLCGLSFLTTILAAKSFSASNLYYAAGLRDNQQTALLDGLKGAGIKVLRVWLDGESPIGVLICLMIDADLITVRSVGYH
jgi:mannan endo-1,4-beta-mannosidase